ncbi:MAG: hypothetical protein ACE37H_03645 [Phycisphaeraceae bacterium]
MNPDETRDAHHLLRVLQDQGIRVTASLGDGFSVIQAVDESGEIHQVRRDDTNLLAAVIEISEMMGWEFG